MPIVSRPSSTLPADSRRRAHSSPWRRITPVIITVVTTLGLLVPMGLAFLGNAPLAHSVEELQLDWLRLAVRIDEASPAEIGSLTRRLDQVQLRELSRFSRRLAEALDELPSAVAEVENTVASGDAVSIEHIMDVDAMIAIVREEAGVLDAQQDAAYAGLITFVMIAAVGFGILWAYQSIRVNRLTLEAKESRRIAALERRVRDQERSKLARDLHDGAAQELAVAGMAIDLMAKEGSIDHLPALNEAIRSARDEVRLIYRTMDPRFSKPSELPAVLRELAAGIEQRSGQHFDVCIDSVLPASWNSETLLHLYRIIQECMHNVVRHAGATWAAVSLQSEDIEGHSVVIARIEDNGTGIGSSAEGYGRRGIRERVELLHGSVVWNDRRSGGTLVEVVLPGE